MLTLARVFFDYDLDVLQAIASLWDGELAATDRAAAAEELATLMARPEAVTAVWDRLSEEQKQAIYDLRANEDHLPLTHFVRRYGEIRPMGPARREREKPWLAPESITEALYYRGLIARVFEPNPAGTQEYAIIPVDLRPLLPQPAPDAVPRAPGYAVAPPYRLAVDHLMAADDVTALVGYLLVRQANARDWLANTPIEIVDRHLRRPRDPAYRALLATLLYDLKLIHDEEMMTQVITQVDREAARPWLEGPRPHQLRSLAEAWVASLTWNDLSFTPGIEADNWPNEPRLARQTLMDALRDVPPEIWWSADGVIEHIKQTNPDFQRPGGDYGGWYLRDAASGEIMHGFQFWDNIEGAVLRFMIEGPMRWLGLLRVGPGAFMLTPLGLALLGRAEWPSEPDAAARIKVDEQGVISVPIDVSRYERLQIARFSAWISAPLPTMQVGGKQRKSGGEDEGVYLYRLTPQAIRRVAEEGIDVGKIVSFLQKLSGQSVPANVVKMLEAWEAQPDEVIVQDVVILTARDLGVYERLHKNERVRRWLGQSVGPQSHMVKREDYPSLMNALRQMGILPLFEGHEKDDWP